MLLSRILPPIRIHCWGGFGSQLHALAIQNRIIEKYKFRRVRLIFHSSGISRRVPTLLTIFPELDCKFVDDFNVERVESIISQSSRKVFKYSLIQILIFLGLFSKMNMESDFAKLRPWIYEIRGHYSYFAVSSDFIEKLFTRVVGIDSALNRTLAVHYRLGDLIDLNSKSFVDPNTLMKLIQELDVTKFEIIRVFSDTPNEASEMIANIFQPVDIEFCDTDVINTMKECVAALDFIGTNSKISFWIAAIRAQKLKKVSYIPLENATSMSHIFGHDNPLVKYYE